MRSRAEWVLRVAAVGLLAWALWGALRPARSAAVSSVDAGSLRAALARWSSAAPPTAVHVTLGGGDVLPGYARQWLMAFRRDGVGVTWGQPLETSVAPLVASALEAEAVADPRGGTRVRVAAPGGAGVVVRDALGPLDSVRVGPRAQGATVMIPASLRTIDGVVGSTPARGAVVDSLTLRHVLVLGRAGWESKFIVRSLEEEGWPVDVHLAVAPRNDVVEGKPTAIDTALYAAVIAIDSSVAPVAPRIATYVRSGGGLVVVGSAAQVFHELDSGAPGVRVRDDEGAPSDTAPRRSLGLMPVTQLAVDAVVLERRGDLVAVAARRVGTGRVVQVGYDDTWRWRMAGGDSSATRHRAWWAAVVSSVAYAPRSERPVPADVDVAPLAHLVDALGAPTAPAASTAFARRLDIDPLRSPWIFGVLLLALLVEWASRRLRGRR
ncbi:MAG TPA: hypothetical protein VNW46_08840 [Gemmatimonadaceae bacterium]|nr:hypothetical protein [Gemmatimonadaceae bacterium]